jgi:hypothetical protein
MKADILEAQLLWVFRIIRHSVEIVWHWRGSLSGRADLDEAGLGVWLRPRKSSCVFRTGQVLEM